MQSVNNEMSKGAQTIAPVDNTKDELYAILRKRLFKAVEAREKDIQATAEPMRQSSRGRAPSSSGPR